MARLPAPESGVCIVDGCDEIHQSRGLCGRHYQQWRRSPTGEPPLAEVKAARDREWLIKRVLTFGFLGEGQVSPFADEAERRQAWEEFGEELTANFRDDGRGAGHRSWGWWRYVAQRDQYLGRCPSMHAADLTERTRWTHLASVEKFTWMAENGHLTDAERKWIAERGREARKRIGTPGEHKAALSPDYGGDKEAVAIAEAVEASR